MKRMPASLKSIGLLLLFLLVSATKCENCDCEFFNPEEEIEPESMAWVELTPEVIDFGPVIVGHADTALIQANRRTRYGDVLPYGYNVAITRNFPDFYLLSAAGAESLVTDTVTVADPTDEFPVVFAPPAIGVYSSSVKTRAGAVSVTDTVHLEGIGVEGCAFSRNHIDFGDVDVGVSRLDTFVVRNITRPTGEHDVTIQVDIINCEFLKFMIDGSPTYDSREWTLAAGEAAICTLQFTPPGAGEHACPLETGNESYCGPIFVTGRGVGSTLGDWETCVTGRWPDLYDIDGTFYGSAYAVGDSGIVAAGGSGAPSCNWNINSQTYIDTISFRGIWVESGDEWIAGSEVGDVWGGAHVFRNVVGHWIQQDSVITIEHYTCGWASSVNDIYFFGIGVESSHNGRHFNGTTWENVLVDWGMSEVTDVWGSGPEDVWATLNQSSYNLWHYDGTTWEDRSEAWMNENLHGVWVDASGVAFVVGTNGAIYYFDGSYWYDQSVGGTRTLYGVFGSSPLDVHAVGEDAVLYHYDGFTWRLYATPPGITVDLRDVWVHRNGEAWAVGQRGTILYHPGP